MGVAIGADGLTKVFGRGAGRLRAVDHVDFEVRQGEVFGFLGPNGAGKSTTIKMITGISRPSSGRATVLGKEISPDQPGAKRLLGYMPEIPGFYPGMRGREHLLFWANMYRMPRAEASRRADDLLAQVGLAEAADRRAKDYSHGMKKRLALAGALIADPAVLVLDEPSGGLDPEGTLFFRNLIDREKRAGKTIFLSSHLLPEVQMICTRVGIIHRGRMLALDTVDELARKVQEKAPNRVQVQCPPLTGQQRAAVSAIPGVSNFAPHPTGITVEAEPGAPIGYELNKALMDAGVRVEAFWPVLPSLEEVFLQLIKDAPVQGAPGGAGA